MMMKERLILGISGSPRKGANTDLMLMEAMKAAETWRESARRSFI